MKKLCFLIIWNCLLCAKEVDEQKIVQEKSGNLALRPSQQPSPLFSFGQWIVDKDTFLTQLDFNSPEIRQHKDNHVIPTLLFGLTDYCALFITLPFAPQKTPEQTAGFLDMNINFEFLLISKSTVKSTTQTTFLITPILPTGSGLKNSPSNNSAFGLFLGSTYSYMATDWYYYASGGYLINTRNRQKIKSGDVLLYQGGCGRCLGNPWGTIFTIFFECNGAFEQYGWCNNKKDCNTGGNVIYFGPTVWLSSEHFLLTVGVEFPIQQSLNGKQGKNETEFAFEIGWTFH